MPAFRGISLTLESQYDIMILPEYPSPDIALHYANGDPSRSLHSKSSVSSFKLPSSAPKFNDSIRSSKTKPPLIEVYVPSYPSSQFWVSYEVVPSRLSKLLRQTRFVYFKLVLGGQCVVSWGVGEEDEWKGKTVWGMFRDGSDSGIFGRKAVKKKGFFFRVGEVEQELEIQVFRARGRRRASREFGQADLGRGRKDIELVNLGYLDEASPQRFYQYALLDPVDEPYATFRYCFRTWKQLSAMGVLPSTGISPKEETEAGRSSDSSPPISARDATESTQDQGDGLPSVQSGVLDSTGVQEALNLMRRLSIPPRVCLVPTSSTKEPCSPVKRDIVEKHSCNVSPISETSDSEQSTAEDPTDWLVRTPSPIKLDHEKLLNPPSPSSRTTTARLLKGVLQSALRRKASETL